MSDRKEDKVILRGKIVERATRIITYVSILKMVTSTYIQT